MLKKSFKYLLIATGNFMLLILLFIGWADELELTFNDYLVHIELLKITGFTLLSLLGMRILVSYFRKKGIVATPTKLKVAVVLTFLLSSYLYVDYSIRFVNHVVINKSYRKAIADKIEPLHMLAYGSKADSLTVEEYRTVASMTGFPEVPSDAINIRYEYGYDGFLPDFLFTLEYDAPDTAMYKYNAKKYPFKHVTVTEYAD